MSQLVCWGAVLTGAMLFVACSDTERAPPSASGGKAGSNGSAAGGDTASAGGALDAEGGADATEAGSGNGAGEASGGAAGASLAGSSTGGTSEPIPPIGDPPRCAHGATWGQGSLVAHSSDDDDLLQSITSSELSLAWKAGDEFYVADRTDTLGQLGPAQRVEGGSAYLAVTLTEDGLGLVAVTKALSMVELSRSPGGVFDATTAVEGAFADFNGSVASSPDPGKVLAEPVLGAQGESLFYTYYSTELSGTQPTLRESRRIDGSWSFVSMSLGSLLEGTVSERRIPTGLSTDGLTLFYADEVEGDFRMAWRINPTVPFDYSETLDLGTVVYAAAPNSACDRVYFSAEGESGLDLFVSNWAQ